MNHSRSPQPRGSNSVPFRPTCPRSAANTPSWQVTEESTRTVVLTEANGTFSFSVFWAHSSGLTERIVKYDANSAAKNISSLESQMIVPTLTMLGRSWCPCRREAGMVVAVATGSLCPAPFPEPPRGPRVPTSVNSHRAALRSEPPRHGVAAGSRAARGDGLGGRALPPRHPRPAPARRRLAGGPDGDVRGCRDGVVLRRDLLRAGGLRHDPAERPHGSAHGALDAGPARARARGPHLPRAAHAAARPAPVAPGRAALPGREGAVVPAAHPRALRRLAVGALLLLLVRRHAEPRLAPRADAPAPGRRRHPVLLADHRHRPGAGAGGLSVPDAPGGAHAPVPRLPGRHDHGAGDAAGW